MAYEADIADKLSALETLTNRRVREEGSRRNVDVDVEEFDIVGVHGRTVGVLTVRELMDPSLPFHVHRTVTRQ